MSLILKLQSAVQYKVFVPTSSHRPGLWFWRWAMGDISFFSAPSLPMCVCVCVCVCVCCCCCCCSVAQSCVWLFATPWTAANQASLSTISRSLLTQVHRVGDAIQPSHPLLSPSPPAFNFPQHQGFFQWISSSHQVAKVSELQHQFFQQIFIVCVCKTVYLYISIQIELYILCIL